MVWQVELSCAAKKQLATLDRPIAQRILTFLNSRVANLDNPRSIGEALKGAKLGEFWKYRVGNYRVIGEIIDAKLVIQVVKIGNRHEVYK